MIVVVFINNKPSNLKINYLLKEARPRTDVLSLVPMSLNVQKTVSWKHTPPATTEATQAGSVEEALVSPTTLTSM